MALPHRDFACANSVLIDASEESDCPPSSCSASLPSVVSMSDSTSEGMEIGRSSVCPWTVDGGIESPLSVGKDDKSGEAVKEGLYLCFAGLAHSTPSVAGGVQNSMLSRQVGAIE